MEKNAWDERRRSLEDEFFARQNRELIENLHAKQSHEQALTDLGQALGIKDRDVLGRLVELDMTPSTALALSLIPLVSVAWADGTLDDKEREAILNAANEQGIGHGTAAHDLLLSWLKQKPAASLVRAWELYIHGLKEALNPKDFVSLKTQILERAHTVAAAAGGILGFGDKVSAAEHAELERLAGAFRS